MLYVTIPLLLLSVAADAREPANMTVSAAEVANLVLRYEPGGVGQELDYLSAAQHLFDALPTDASTDQMWDAVYRIRTFCDGAAHEEFAYMAFVLSREHPLVFYRRFVAGDSFALVLQEDVFLTDTLVLHDYAEGDEARSAEVEAALDQVVDAVRKAAPTEHSDEARLHRAFASQLASLRARWETQRAGLVQLRQK